MNDALRRALADARLRETDVASRMGVDPKTVRRWIDGRLPLLRHRWALADLVRRDEADLWPEASPSLGRCGTGGEVRATYPHRHAVPPQVWRHLFEAAEHDIGILVDSGLFLLRDANVLPVLAEKARAGVNVRILLDDPDDARVAPHGSEDGADDASAAKIREAIALYRPLREVPGVEIRLHRTIPYTSICRADDELLVNPHLYGIPGAQAPVLHLRKAASAHMTANYLATLRAHMDRGQPTSPALRSRT